MRYWQQMAALATGFRRGHFYGRQFLPYLAVTERIPGFQHSSTRSFLRPAVFAVLATDAVGDRWFSTFFQSKSQKRAWQILNWICCFDKVLHAMLQELLTGKQLGMSSQISSLFSFNFQLFQLRERRRKRKFQLLNRQQQQLTIVTRYIDVITTNFSQKMPNYTTKHPVA